MIVDPGDALNRNVHQGLHGEGFIYSLACAGGFTTSRMNLDIDGVDWQIAYPGPRGTTRSPKIEIQVKTSAELDVRDGLIHHRLRVAHFNNLAGLGFQVPRFLALVAVPSDVADYAVCTDDHMMLSTAAYWLSLADQEVRPSGEGAAGSIVVQVPLRNLLTVTALQSLLDGDPERAAQ